MDVTIKALGTWTFHSKLDYEIAMGEVNNEEVLRVCLFGNKGEVENLLSRYDLSSWRDENNDSLLHFVMYSGNRNDIAESLIKNGSDKNAVNIVSNIV